MGDPALQLSLSGDFEILIGSGAECEVRIPALLARHARLARRGDRLFLQDLSPDGSVSVNGRARGAGKWTELTRHDEVLLGGIVLDLSPRFFLGRDRLNLVAEALTYRLPGNTGRLVCDRVSIEARPGELTAILGPAGSGKTILLNLLAGMLQPTAGRVRIGNLWDPHREVRLVREFLGYVPQGDALFPDLTVCRSLETRLRLKFPDMQPETIERLIRHACVQLGFEGERLERFLGSRIGGLDATRRGLSGGERRRANIAHELVSRPLIVLLDEPTSGLASSDASQVTQLLSRLCRQDHLTVVATIHQPSPECYALFDRVLVLADGGRPIYCGPAEEAVDSLEQRSKRPCLAENPAEYLLELASDRRLAPVLADQHQVELAERHEIQPPPVSTAAAVHPRGRAREHLGRRIHHLLRGQLYLGRRSLSILLADRWSLTLNVIQAPVIALLIAVAFWGGAADHLQADRFARTIYFFDQAKAPIEERAGTVPVDALLQEAEARAGREKYLIGESHARFRSAVYFVLVASAIWLGVTGSCREIVGEAAAIRRELRTCLTTGPYVCSKIAVQSLIRAVQGAFLAVTLGQWVLALPWRAVLLLWLALWLVGLASALMGLWLSAASPDSRFALTLIPLVIIPQLLFGGFLRPEKDASGALPVVSLLSGITLQYWGFRAALAVDDHSGLKPLQTMVNPKFTDRYWELNIVRYETTTLIGLHFINAENGGALKVIGGFLALFSALTLGVVSIRLSGRWIW
jgi:ABC-type multidrug transport system ATPase subunit